MYKIHFQGNSVKTEYGTKGQTLAGEDLNSLISNNIDYIKQVENLGELCKEEQQYLVDQNAVIHKYRNVIIEAIKQELLKEIVVLDHKMKETLNKIVL